MRTSKPEQVACDSHKKHHQEQPSCSWAMNSSSQEPPLRLYSARSAQSDTINIDHSAHSTSLAMKHTMAPEGEEEAGPISVTLPY